MLYSVEHTKTIDTWVCFWRRRHQKYVGRSYRLSSHENTDRMFRAHRILQRQAKFLQAMMVASFAYASASWMVYESGNPQFENVSARNNQHLVWTASTKTYKLALFTPVLVILWA